MTTGQLASLLSDLPNDLNIWIRFGDVRVVRVEAVLRGDDEGRYALEFSENPDAR